MLTGLTSYLHNMTYPELGASILAIIGVWYISIPKFRGQVFMLAAQMLWIFHSLIKESPGLLVQSLVLFALNVKAIYSWYKKGIGLRTEDARDDNSR